MQNRYAGDVGDFGKLGLLRRISLTGLKIGVNWYLTPNETHNEDGKHIGYLSDGSFINCDDDLRSALNQIVSGNRSVSALEKSELIPNAVYYNQLLLPPSEAFSRQKWHSEALAKLQDADIVFLDPDNGLLVKSMTTGSKKSNKYVHPSEIVDYYKAGKSIIFYNHRCREKEALYIKKFESLFDNPFFNTAHFAGVKFVRGTIRDYIFILQPNHAVEIAKIIDNMLMSPWSRHFLKLAL